jgi:cell division protein FtsL
VPGTTRGRSSGGVSKRESHKKAALRRRRFAVVVVLPALLMMGSVYVHTVSAGVHGQIDVLEERLAAAKAEKQELEVRVSELSQPGRVREAARQIGMKDAAGADIKVYAKDGEDGADNRGEARAHAAP